MFLISVNPEKSYFNISITCQTSAGSMDLQHAFPHMLMLYNKVSESISSQRISGKNNMTLVQCDTFEITPKSSLPNAESLNANAQLISYTYNHYCVIHRV